MCGASNAEWIAYFASWANILTLVVGLYALGTWRKQLRASAEHEAALNLLATAIQLREAMKAYRNPLRESWELGEDTSRARRERSVLENRSRFYLEPAKADLRRCQVPATVLWDGEIAPLLKKLTDCVFELDHQTVYEYLRRLDNDVKHEIESVFFVKAEATVVRPIGKEVDSFGDRVDEAVRELEAFLRPKLAGGLGGQEVAS